MFLLAGLWLLATNIKLGDTTTILIKTLITITLFKTLTNVSLHKFFLFIDISKIIK